MIFALRLARRSLASTLTTRGVRVTTRTRQQTDRPARRPRFRTRATEIERGKVAQILTPGRRFACIAPTATPMATRRPVRTGPPLWTSCTA